MGGVSLVVRAELRSRWRAWLALVVLVALGGGAVLGAVEAARRTASAFPRFAARYSYDTYVYGFQPLPGLSTLPQVASILTASSTSNGDLRCTCRFSLPAAQFSVLEMSPSDVRRYNKLVSGRWAEPGAPDELLAPYNLQGKGLRLGSRVQIGFYGPDQVQALEQNQALAPDGPTSGFRVVGFVANVDAFPALGTPGEQFFSTPAFAARVNSRIGLFSNYIVRLKRHAADTPAFDAAARRLGAVALTDELNAGAVTNAIHPQSVGWWVLAAFAALAVLVTVGQALRRQAMAEAETTQRLAALGMGGRRLAAVAMARAAGIGLAGGALAAVVGFALSPMAPVGEARVADVAPGLSFDAPVFFGGAAAIALLVIVLGIWPALTTGRLTRPVPDVGHPPSPVVGALAAIGAPAAMSTGVRRALERGRGAAAIPNGNALMGAALAVTALCGTAVFGASLGHLTTTPRLYGQAFQAWFNSNGPGLTGAQAVATKALGEPGVDAVTIGTSATITVAGSVTDAIAGQAARGPLLVSAVRGRTPIAADEVALGQKTLQRAHAHIGSEVVVGAPAPGGGTRSDRFRVVGVVSFPPDFGVVGLNSGAIFTNAGLERAQCGADGACIDGLRATSGFVVLVSVAPGAEGRAALARMAREEPADLVLPIKPTNLVNFGDAVDFPLILGLVVVLFGAATMLHVLIVSLARRRREVALLKTLGFVRRQVTAVMCWQATTLALVGVVVGVPLGIAGGRWVWRLFATNLGVVPVPVVQPVVIAALAAGSVVAANALAAIPAVMSAATPVARTLRHE